MEAQLLQHTAYHYFKIFIIWMLIHLFYSPILSQSVPNQGAYVHRGATLAVFSMHSFSTGGLFFAPGVIGTERTPISGKVLFARGSLWMNAGHYFYIDGYVSVSEQRPFTFPIGDNGFYRPIALSNAEDADAAYFGVDASEARTSRIFGGDFPILPQSGPFDTNALSTSVNNVSTKEYWDINGDQFSYITLTWNDSSDIVGLTENNIDQLGIVGWNGSEWEYIPSFVDQHSLTIENAIPSFLDEPKIDKNGSVTTAIPIAPNQYEIYSFGCIADKSKTVVSVEVLEDSGLSEFCLDSLLNDFSMTDSISICSEDYSGTVSISSNCVYYQPLKDDNGIENVCLLVVRAGIKDTIDLAISILPVNDPPIAQNDTFVLDNSFQLTIDVMSNDFDIDGDLLTLNQIISQPINGSIEIESGYLKYLPSNEFLGFDSLQYEICDFDECDTAWVILEVNNLNGDSMVCVEINAQVYLEGAFDPVTDAMHTLLNDRRYLPGQDPFTFFGDSYPAGQPYLGTPWTYLGSEGDSLDANLIGHEDAGYGESIVDYVLVSIRSANSIVSTECQKVGLLHQDGDITFFEDLSCCMLDKNRSYYILIEHRNHLPVLSSNAIYISNDSLSYDFRFEDSFIEALGLGQKEIRQGIFAMYGGNGDQNIGAASRVDINVRDLGAWLVDDGQNSSYYIMDFDLNGDVNVQDKGLLLQNLGIFTDVNF